MKLNYARVNRRATEPPSHRATEPPSHRATEPPSHQATEPPSRRATEPPSHRATEPPSRRATDPIRSDPIRSDPIRSDPIRSDPIRKTSKILSRQKQKCFEKVVKKQKDTNVRGGVSFILIIFGELKRTCIFSNLKICDPLFFVDDII